MPATSVRREVEIDTLIHGLVEIRLVSDVNEVVDDGFRRLDAYVRVFLVAPQMELQGTAIGEVVEMVRADGMPVPVLDDACRLAFLDELGEITQEFRHTGGIAAGAGTGGVAFRIHFVDPADALVLEHVRRMDGPAVLREALKNRGPLLPDLVQPLVEIRVHDRPPRPSDPWLRESPIARRWHARCHENDVATTICLALTSPTSSFPRVANRQALRYHPVAMPLSAGPPGR